jgi:hypothetical protein
MPFKKKKNKKLDKETSGSSVTGSTPNPEEGRQDEEAATAAPALPPRKKIVPNIILESSSDDSQQRSPGRPTGKKPVAIDNGGLDMTTIHGPYRVPHDREEILERGGLYIPNNDKKPSEQGVTATSGRQEDHHHRRYKAFRE